MQDFFGKHHTVSDVVSKGYVDDAVDNIFDAKKYYRVYAIREYITDGTFIVGRYVYCLYGTKQRWDIDSDNGDQGVSITASVSIEKVALLETITEEEMFRRTLNGEVKQSDIED